MTDERTTVVPLRIRPRWDRIPYVWKQYRLLRNKLNVPRWHAVRLCLMILGISNPRDRVERVFRKITLPSSEDLP